MVRICLCLEGDLWVAKLLVMGLLEAWQRCPRWPAVALVAGPPRRECSPSARHHLAGGAERLKIFHSVRDLVFGWLLGGAMQNVAHALLSLEEQRMPHSRGVAFLPACASLIAASMLVSSGSGGARSITAV